MKLNWGTGLAIVLGLFILGMGTVTYQAMNQRHDLVTTDYYQKELAYQNTIDAKKNAEKLTGELRFVLENGKVQLHFPEEIQGQPGQLELELYYPTMAERDFTIKETDWSVSTIDLPTEQLSAGKWIAKAQLESGGKPYYFETEINL